MEDPSMNRRARKTRMAKGRVAIRRPLAAIVSLALVLSGCETTPRVDHGVPGFDETRFENDLAACRKKATKEAARDGFLGLLAGLVVAPLWVFTTMQPRTRDLDDREVGFAFAGIAAAGALLGGIWGAGQAKGTTSDCLRHRGYAVSDSGWHERARTPFTSSWQVEIMTGLGVSYRWSCA